MNTLLYLLSMVVTAQSAATNTRPMISYDHGIMTAYATNWTGGHCGFSHFPSPVAERYFIAISIQDEEGWMAGLNCGACVRLTYTDGKVGGCKDRAVVIRLVSRQSWEWCPTRAVVATNITGTSPTSSTWTSQTTLPSVRVNGFLWSWWLIESLCREGEAVQCRGGRVSRQHRHREHENQGEGRLGRLVVCLAGGQHQEPNQRDEHQCGRRENLAEPGWSRASWSSASQRDVVCQASRTDSQPGAHWGEVQAPCRVQYWGHWGGHGGGREWRVRDARQQWENEH